MGRRSSQFVLIKNAIANVVRGSAAALVAVILPPFLVRFMTTEAFGVWSLVLQLSAYTALLDFGVQTAVGRFVAHADELADTDRRDRIVSTSFALLVGSALLGALAMAALAWQLPNLFRELPPAYYADARLALLIVGGATAIGLPASVFNGIFIGMQRNEVPAAIIGGSRIISALLLIAVAYLGGGIVAMAIVVAGVNLLSYLVQYLASRGIAKTVRISTHLISKPAAKELIAYCISLSIWSLAMLLISGVDTTIVAVVDFEAVGYYTIAASLITFIAGLQNALFSTLMPAAAVLDARNDHQALGLMLLAATRYGMFILLATGLPLIIGAAVILNLWVGPEYAGNSRLILQILVAANIIRLSATPYAVLLIGTGQQRILTITPIIEGLVNVCTSIVAGTLFGPIGVALGTLVGAIVAFICNLLFNMPRTRQIPIELPLYLRDGLLRPLVCGAPVCAWAALRYLVPISSPSYGALSLVLALGLTVALVWRVGLVSAERIRIKALLRPLRSSFTQETR